MSEDLVSQKEQELAGMVFEWAKENGLAELPDQIHVSIKILKRVYTFELTEEDWGYIMDRRRFRWNNDEVAYLQQFKDAYPNPLKNPTRVFWQTPQRVMHKLRSAGYGFTRRAREEKGEVIRKALIR